MNASLLNEKLIRTILTPRGDTTPDPIDWLRGGSFGSVPGATSGRPTPSFVHRLPTRTSLTQDLLHFDVLNHVLLRDQPRVSSRHRTVALGSFFGRFLAGFFASRLDEAPKVPSQLMARIPRLGLLLGGLLLATNQKVDADSSVDFC